jgi:hypothetical protein
MVKRSAQFQRKRKKRINAESTEEAHRERREEKSERGEENSRSQIVRAHLRKMREGWGAVKPSITAA